MSGAQLLCSKFSCAEGDIVYLFFVRLKSKGQSSKRSDCDSIPGKTTPYCSVFKQWLGFPKVNEFVIAGAYKQKYNVRA